MLTIGIITLILCRDYLGLIVSKLASLHGFSGPLLFISLFIAVAFPIVWGYLILNVGAGYTYGFYWGFIITCIGANIGALLSLLLCRRIFKSYVLKKISHYENFKQIIRVIDGRQGMRIMTMARLTPVPFGLQNALFSASNVSVRKFCTTTFIGSVPTQILNAYMGASLRSVEDVLAGKNSNSFFLIFQFVLAIALTYYINQRMKKEVHLACEREVRPLL